MLKGALDLTYKEFTDTPTREIRGKFFGDFILRPLHSDDLWETAAEFGYVSKEGVVVIVPIGTPTDGLSIPSFAWSVVGNPFQPRPAPAAVIHDYECAIRIHSARSVHDRFYEMLRIRKFNRFRSWLYWQAVRNFGPKW